MSKVRQWDEPLPEVLPSEPEPKVLPDEDEIWSIPKPKITPRPKAFFRI